MLVNLNAFVQKKYKITDHDAVLKLNIWFSKIMKIHHVFGHQDRSKDKYLTLQAKLNIRADKLITVNTRHPLQININNTSVFFI